MLHSTRGIVFHTVKYSETSIIAKIYTDLFGIQSYLFRGIRGTKSKTKPGLFQSMTLLDLVVYHKENQSLQSVKEVHLAHAFKSIPFDIIKSSVALFINELLYKVIREEEPNPALFDFLWTSTQQLDDAETSVSGFHITFAVRLMHFLGIFPHDNYSALSPVFNMREGLFQPAIPDHPYYLLPDTSVLLHKLLESSGEPDELPGEPVDWNHGGLFPNAGSRKQILETILVYYQLHLPGFKGVQSHLILHDVLA
jgi:DNA repair protein RecO (recombination protein O)